MRYSLTALLLCVFSSTASAQTTMPHTFVAGTAAKASDVNDNFKALVADSRVPSSPPLYLATTVS